MRALTIAQPWAEMIARRRKHYETRSWATHYRGRLAIHAARVGSSGVTATRMQQLADEWGFRVTGLVTSAIIATCSLVDVFEVDRSFLRTLDDEERQYGDYSLGRFAWRLANVRRVEPLPCQGKLGIWMPSPEIVRRLAS
jgi:hypothetical protein